MRRKQVWKLSVYRYKNHCTFSIERNDTRIYFDKIKKEYDIPNYRGFKLLMKDVQVATINLDHNKIIHKKTFDMKKSLEETRKRKEELEAKLFRDYPLNLE